MTVLQLEYYLVFHDNHFSLYKPLGSASNLAFKLIFFLRNTFCHNQNIRDLILQNSQNTDTFYSPEWDHTHQHVAEQDASAVLLTFE